MFRKDLIGILHDRPASLHELALLLGVRPQELEGDLHHLLKSLKNMPYHAIITPASCRKCGFVFHDDKLHKPGKCPRCHGTWISDPVICIEERR
ncbi:MAG: transcriptional regulator [Gammaproteobacteria bacterium]|jgi:predicted Zn-ribbon and HTH transcriptional regulator